MYAASTAFFKISIGVFLTRICSKKYQTYVIWAVLTVVILFSTYFVILLVFQCRPVSFLWTKFEGESGKCLSADVLTGSTYAHSAISTIADLVLGTLPVLLLWNLNMNIQSKMSVALILGLGALYV
jgi:hypothetical protein